MKMWEVEKLYGLVRVIAFGEGETRLPVPLIVKLTKIRATLGRFYQQYVAEVQEARDGIYTGGAAMNETEEQERSATLNECALKLLSQETEYKLERITEEEFEHIVLANTKPVEIFGVQYQPEEFIEMVYLAIVIGYEQHQN